MLANRLSEDPGVSVLLLEAGRPDTADFIHIPAAFPALYRSKDDWDLGTGYEPHLDDRRVYLPRGKVLGGSSSLNAMIYIRGNPADYDEWAEQGCAGWGWDDLLPYFLRAEDNVRGAGALPRRGRPAAGVGRRSRAPGSPRPSSTPRPRSACPRARTSTPPTRTGSAGTR